MPDSPTNRPLDRDSGKTLRAPHILAALLDEYDGGVIELDHSSPFELLIATVLSAQSTDVKINEITKTLFTKYPGPEDYLAVPEEELQDDIRSSGFFRQKTKSIRGLCQALLADFDGEVPLRMADLVTLPGVARKTANVVLAGSAPEALLEDPDAGIAVDTHVTRLSKRFGFTKHSDAVKIEKDLMRLFPREHYGSASLVIILHGRRVCDALRPACGGCVVEEWCPSSLIAGRRDKAKQAKSLGDPA
ncbi:endonuclease III [Euzebya tangerina]|uniref:endonuclease III n=1 Tax=Euzebya tangerina TaxID=591198 RepID=UPI000E3208C7|nr:endonuclease III [Euzebya tangerina]